MQLDLFIACQPLFGGDAGTSAGAHPATEPAKARRGVSCHCSCSFHLSASQQAGNHQALRLGPLAADAVFIRLRKPGSADAVEFPAELLVTAGPTAASSRVNLSVGSAVFPVVRHCIIKVGFACNCLRCPFWYMHSIYTILPHPAVIHVYPTGAVLQRGPCLPATSLPAAPTAGSSRPTRSTRSAPGLCHPGDAHHLLQYAPADPHNRRCSIFGQVRARTRLCTHHGSATVMPGLACRSILRVSAGAVEQLWQCHAALWLWHLLLRLPDPISAAV
jgi:hypothetical protein